MKRDYLTIKGERVRSLSEAFIANFLSSHGIEYEYERPLSSKRTFIPDFYLKSEETYVEFFGELNEPRYRDRTKRKIEYYKDLGIRFIFIQPEELPKLESIFFKKLEALPHRNYCSVCGSRVEVRSNYCNSCGTSLCLA